MIFITHAMPRNLLVDEIVRIGQGSLSAVNTQKDTAMPNKGQAMAGPGAQAHQQHTTQQPAATHNVHAINAGQKVEGGNG